MNCCYNNISMNQKQTTKKSNDALTFKQFCFLNEDNLILLGCFFFLFVLKYLFTWLYCR